VIITLYKLHNKVSCESLSSCRACSRDRRVEPVVSSESSCAEMHGLDTSNVSSRAKWNLGLSDCVTVTLHS